MNFEYGKITDLKEDERGYITISINQNLAFRKILRKFSVWNVEYLKRLMGDVLRIDSSVRYQAVKNGRYYKLHTIEESAFSECFGCGSYTPIRDAQQMECQNCVHSMARERIDKYLKVVKNNIKQYKFSSGVTLLLVDEMEESLVKTLCYNNLRKTALYSKACGLDVGSVQQFRGWVNNSAIQLTILFEAVDIDDM